MKKDACEHEISHENNRPVLRGTPADLSDVTVSHSSCEPITYETCCWHQTYLLPTLGAV